MGILFVRAVKVMLVRLAVRKEFDVMVERLEVK
jgi:hypothetical protein